MLFDGVKSVVSVLVVLAAIVGQLSMVQGDEDLPSEVSTPSSNILLITMGATRSHKIPFFAMAEGLIAKGHRVTLLSGYASQGNVKGLEEIVPEKFQKLVSFFDDYDYLGTRIRNQFFKNFMDIIKYARNACAALLSDPETKALLNRKFHVVIIDSIYPYCALGMAAGLRAPVIYFNTMTNMLDSIAGMGSPAPWSISPNFALPFTNRMSFLQRVGNAVMHSLVKVIQFVVGSACHHSIQKHLGKDIPHPKELQKNVSMVLQNGHVTVSHAQPFLPNVIEVGGVHCRPAKPLPEHLNSYLDGAGEEGFIYVSMGTSVNPKTMPPAMLKVFVAAFSQLPYRILWKFDSDLRGLKLPANVRIENWLPQQDILSHKNIKAFVTHSGMFGTLETVYHGVPIITLPVFGDQDSNAAKVVEAGYGLRIELKTVTEKELITSITRVVVEPRFRAAVKRAQRVLRHQRHSPLDTAVYWTEYVIRHKGAAYWQSPARDLNWIQYYGFDVALFFGVLIAIILKLVQLSRKYFIRVRWEKEKLGHNGVLKTKVY